MHKCYLCKKQTAAKKRLLDLFIYELQGIRVYRWFHKKCQLAYGEEL